MASSSSLAARRPPRKRAASARCLLLLAGFALLAAVLPGAASAHPLGNFTINHYSRIEVGARQIQIAYVVDMAEIPAFQEKQTIDRNGDGKIEESERSAYLAAKVPQLLTNLHLSVNGQQLPLTATASSLSFPPGQGGLTTLRLTATIEAASPAEANGSADATYRDDNYGERLGWKEIVVRGGLGASIEHATVSAQDQSHELRSYPKDMLSSPLNERSASFSIRFGAAAAAEPAAGTQPATPGGGSVGRAIAVADNAFADLVSSRSLTLPVILISLLAAMALGGLHALSPGHGKTIAGAYLVSSRATGKHALFLGLTVTATHTSSVFLLGLVTLTASQFIVPERLYPILNLGSGLIILTIGAALTFTRGRHFLEGRFRRRQMPRLLRSARPSAAAPEPVLVAAGIGAGEALSQTEWEDLGVHHHEHVNESHGVEGHEEAFAEAHAHHALGDGSPGHHHHHDGDHDHHGHSHLPPGADGRPITWRSLLALGISGGLLPCPSALVVLLSAISLHRLGFGLVLIVAFSIGLAAVLVGIGMLLVYARHLFNRLNTEGGFVQLLPVISAVVITVAGLVLTATALGVRGLPAI